MTGFFQPGSLVEVEVHGLPNDKVEVFIYRVKEPVQVGALVHLPAPDWSIRVTGRDVLPGYVLGAATATTDCEGWYRDILPTPAAIPNTPEEHRSAARDIVKAWRDAADEHVLSAASLRDRANELEAALDGELGF